MKDAKGGLAVLLSAKPETSKDESDYQDESDDELIGHLFDAIKDDDKEAFVACFKALRLCQGP